MGKMTLCGVGSLVSFKFRCWFWRVALSSRHRCRLNMPELPDPLHRDTWVGQSTQGPLPRSQDLPEVLRHRCTRLPRKLVNRDTGRVGSRPIQRAATGAGEMDHATLPFTELTPGWRSVMALRWDIACLMPGTETLPMAHHQCHSNRPMKLPLTTVQSLQARK